MDRDESIELARFLKDEYLAAETLNDKITDHEQRLARPFDMTTEQRSLFYYFKPFLKASVITTLILLLPTYFWASIAEFLAQEHGDHTHYAFRVPFLFPAGIFLLICAIGFIVAKAKLKRFMESEDNRVRADLNLRESMRSELAELQYRLADQTSGLDEYNDLVPSGYRTQRHMKQVENLLLTNKADSFEEAISLLVGQERT
ncbi:MAG: hypothetical protein IKO15_04075 [Clostridiales bacterium]|nr:hypothetical protein [Clostridiales bacterium]